MKLDEKIAKNIVQNMLPTYLKYLCLLGIIPIKVNNLRKVETILARGMLSHTIASIAFWFTMSENDI